MKINEIGRSMIEMLGVLAIVGVLSVGGIAGYSKAMLTYRSNKQIEQLVSIITSIINNKDKMPKIASESYIPYLQALGELPKDIVDETTPERVKLEFGTTMSIYQSGGYVQLIATLKGTGQENLLICKNMFKVAFNFLDDIRLLDSHNGQPGDESRIYFAYYGSKYCNKNRKCLRDVTIADIEEGCQKHSDEGWQGFLLVF